MSVLIVVPDGTGIRNYLFSDIIPTLIKEGKEIIVYHCLDEKSLDEVKKIHEVEFKSQNMIPYKESINQKLLRESIAFARLNYNSKLVENETILFNWNTKKIGLQKLFYKFTEKIGKYASKKYNRILSLEKKYQKSLQYSIKKEIQYLNRIRPESVFCTHQRSIRAIPIITAANQLNIKTIGAIYSWDNIPKARLAVRTKKFIVWSDYMKDEMRIFYPEIDQEKIIVTGTPQFDFYKKQQILIHKADFCKKYNLNINKKIICFSGDDELTSPYDPIYLEHLSEEIKKNNKEESIQILFRRSPVDISNRYNYVLEKFKEIIVPVAPLWSNESDNWSTLFPYYRDVELLANICFHSDLVINIGSTMAHDFAFYNNPAAYLNYDTCYDKNWSVDTIYKFQHFRSMPTNQEVYWINSKNNFLSTINKAIDNKHSLGKDWLKIINIENENISLNIVNEILN
ncbi:hypothetical protein CW731_03475 [Polaribacter sp. ALD11]|uniref:hypothetical protein n=1 Tax=Polaribacter sp. ALD11 TaxID=2058137 RepID=UPI000C316279|nr:hypothetical protein [Polaribacter sp. ALD11]AUC84416.1 hypothetical protein CW731_03475 [Polaribacter sp. ALD11]